VPELVTKEQLSSGIALNAAIYNSARVIGPGLAGFLIALVGTGGAFILNGFSFIAVVIALLMMRVPLYVSKRQLHPLAAIKEGVSYSFSHPMVASLLIFTGVTSVFGWSYGTMMPVIAQNVFHLGAAGLGYLFAINGLGSLLATIGVSVLANKLSPIAVIVGGNTFFAMTLYLFTLTNNLALASFLLFLSGFGLILQFATMNTVLQNVITNEVRGRVMSIYTLMFLGLAPIGNLQIGWLSEKFGPEFAIQVGTAIVLGFGLIIFFRRKKIAAAYARYKENRHLL
jgi:predicted MFS family arabinose efflux permease